MEEKKHQLFQLSQKLVLYSPADKKYLILKDAKRSESFREKYGVFELPGGRVEEGEDPKNVLEREVTEEIGGDVQYTIVGPIHEFGITFHRNEVPVHVVDIAHLAILEKGEVSLSDEHNEFQWVTIDEIRNNDEYFPDFKEIFEKAQQRIVEMGYLTDLKRLQADFDNYKKRQQESQKELGGYLIEKLILDIVPVLDNFRSATMHVPEEQKSSPWVVGIQYIEKQLEDVVKSNGVEVIEVKEGDVFDPTIHEAVSSEAMNQAEAEPSSAKATEGQEQHTVVKVLQKGFKLGGKVIRPAKVTVS